MRHFENEIRKSMLLVLKGAEALDNRGFNFDDKYPLEWTNRYDES
jgi:hypothetical protein